jgi:hypothetical protein
MIDLPSLWILFLLLLLSSASYPGRAIAYIKKFRGSPQRVFYNPQFLLD